MSKHILTLAIPTYNRREIVVKNLENIIDQELYRIADILIIDNSSDDGTYEALKEISNSYENIRILKQDKNVHIYGNCLSLFTETKTKYFAMNSDEDFFVKDGILDLLDLMREKEYGFISGAVKLPKSKGFYREGSYELDYKCIRERSNYFSGTVFNTSYSSGVISFLEKTKHLEFAWLYVLSAAAVYIYSKNAKCIAVNFVLAEMQVQLETNIADAKGRKYYLLDSRIEQYRSYIEFSNILTDIEDINKEKVQRWCNHSLNGFFSTCLHALELENDSRFIKYFKQEALKYPFSLLRSKFSKFLPVKLKFIIKKATR